MRVDFVTRAEALGTPKPSLHWYKDGEEIFLAEGVSIIEKDIGSELRVDNVRIDDGGSFSVSAINTVGKCTASTAVRIGAKPGRARRVCALCDMRRFCKMDILLDRISH